MLHFKVALSCCCNSDPFIFLVSGERQSTHQRLPFFCQRHCKQRTRESISMVYGHCRRAILLSGVVLMSCKGRREFMLFYPLSTCFDSPPRAVPEAK